MILHNAKGKICRITRTFFEFEFEAVVQGEKKRSCCKCSESPWTFVQCISCRDTLMPRGSIASILLYTASRAKPETVRPPIQHLISECHGIAQQGNIIFETYRPPASFFFAFRDEYQVLHPKRLQHQESTSPIIFLPTHTLPPPKKKTKKNNFTPFTNRMQKGAARTTRAATKLRARRGA